MLFMLTHLYTMRVVFMVISSSLSVEFNTSRGGKGNAHSPSTVLRSFFISSAYDTASSAVPQNRLIYFTSLIFLLPLVK